MIAARFALPALLVICALLATSPPTQPGQPFARAPEPGGADTTARISSLGPGGPRYAHALGEAAAVPTSPLTQLQPWRDRGPFSPGGRITDLAWDAARRRLYVASASGGVWISDDDGVTLTPSWPLDGTPAVGAIAVTADGTVLAGTGEANAGGGSITFPGTGVYRSTDGGWTWTASGLADSGTIARLVAHPEDPDVVWAAAGGSLFQPGGQRGIYRSDDGGMSWTRVLDGDTDTTGGADLALDPADPSHLLASMWDRQRTPALRRYGGEGSGLYESTDGGLTWQPISDGIPGFTDDAGRIAVALSPADPDVGYAVVTRGDGRGDGFYRSEDGGRTWRLVNASGQYLASQFIFGWWFSKVFPAPDDAARVLVPGLTLLESTDGGDSFSGDPTVHPDQHALLWHPDDPTRAWVASDGGLYHSDEGGRTFTWTLARQQGFTQPYTAAASPADPTRLAAGFQDLGCLLDEGDGAWRGAANCGDGLVVQPHPTDPQLVLLCGQYGRCAEVDRSDGGGSRRLSMPDVDRAGWGAPLVRLPDEPEHLLFGGESLHRSDDGGRSWQQISGDLTRGHSPDPDYPYGTISEIHPIDVAGQQLVVGTDDGLVWRSDDGGGSWTTLLDGDRWVTGLASADDGDTLLVGTSGYFDGINTAQLRRSRDGGATWEEIQHTLPDAPVNDVLIADDAVVVATDVGVLASWEALDAEEPRWRRIGEGLPQAPVLDLDWLDAQRLLTVATFGRGVWQTTLVDLERVAGHDRFATAALVGAARSGDVEAVVLASGRDFPDALTAAALVARHPGWRLLLTEPDRLPEATASALALWRPDQVIVAGGPAAIDEEVMAQVAALADVEPQRVAGASRYATAVEVARLTGPPEAVILATAGTPFDALAAGALARARSAPVLLVDPDRLPAEVREYLAATGPDAVITVGGPDAVGEDVTTAAAEAAGAATEERLAGRDRIETAAGVAAAATHEAEEVWLAASDAAADALAAGATGRPVLLTSRDGIHPETLLALMSLQPRRVLVAGGDAVVSPSVLAELRHGSPP